MKVICLDTETTGLDRQKDEILQLSIIDGDGNVLFDKYFKPLNRRSWAAAERINGISPADVANCKSLIYYKSEIESILLDADVIVGYNIMSFDFPMLFNNGIKNEVKTGSVICDVMEEYALINGEIDDCRGGFRFKKLKDCAKYFKYPCDTWHNALDDAKATLFCFYAICGNPPDLKRMIAGKHISKENDLVNACDTVKDNAVSAKENKFHTPTWVYNIFRYFFDCIMWLFLFAGLGCVSRSEFSLVVVFSVFVFLSWRIARKCKRVVNARKK